MTDTVILQATIENFGTIQGTGAGGHGSDGLANTSEGIAAGGGSITNHSGATISGLGLGILIDDSSQGNAPFLTTIVNESCELDRATRRVAVRVVKQRARLVVVQGWNQANRMFPKGQHCRDAALESAARGDTTKTRHPSLS